MNQNDYGNILEEHYEDGFAAGHSEGLAEGRAEGHAEGRAEGHAEGRAEGRAEGQAETIRKMVAGGVPLEVIANSLGLSIAEVKEIL